IDSAGLRAQVPKRRSYAPGLVRLRGGDERATGGFGRSLKRTWLVARHDDLSLPIALLHGAAVHRLRNRRSTLRAETNRDDGYTRFGRCTRRLADLVLGLEALPVAHHDDGTVRSGLAGLQKVGRLTNRAGE